VKNALDVRLPSGEYIGYLAYDGWHRRLFVDIVYMPGMTPEDLVPGDHGRPVSTMTLSLPIREFGFRRLLSKNSIVEHSRTGVEVQPENVKILTSHKQIVRLPHYADPILDLEVPKDV
jgi:hypothetical protein